MKRTFQLISGTVLCLSMILGCQKEPVAAAPSHSPIKVVAILSTLGKVAAYGQDNKEGVEAAVADINAKGGINGRLLQIQYETTDGSATTATSLIRKYADDSSYVAILGPTTSGETFAASNLIAQLKNPPLMLSVGSTGLWKPNSGVFRPFDFRSTRNDALIVPEMLNIVYERLKPKKVAILYHQDFEWSVTTLPLYHDFFTKKGVALIEESGSKDSTDWSAQLTKLQSEQPDLIVMNVVAGVAPRIVSQARDMGINGRFIGTAAFPSPKLWEVAGAAIDGTLVGEIFDPTSEDPQVKAFVMAYKQKNGGAPPAYSAYGYAGVQLLAKALSTAKDPDDRNSLREALGALKDVPTVLGTVSYNGSGDITPQHAHVVEISHGEVRAFR
jgi:branched-chain amino acid transport system substrate-binding protein